MPFHLKNKLIAGVLVMGLTASAVLAPMTMSADEAVIKLSREEVGQMAVDASATVRDLEISQQDLATQFTEMNDAMKGLQALYDLLPRYKELYNKFVTVSAIPNYTDYLGYALAFPADIALMLNGAEDPGEALMPWVGLSDGEETALALEVVDPNNMTPAEFGEYSAYQPQFAAMGITDPNLSKEEEYDIFAYPIKGGTMAMQVGVLSMGVGIDVAEVGIASGAETLYDTILMMEGILALQEGSFQMAYSDFVNAREKYLKGQMSEMDFIMMRNKEEIARRNRDSMQRQVDNLVMSFNLMLGLDVDAQIELTTEVEQKVTLESLDFYVERGLKERNEVESFEITHGQKVSDFDLVADYFSKSSYTYKIAKAELEQMNIEETAMLMDIEQNIREAYLNVLEKEENLVIKKLAMDDADRQYKELELNVSLGFVTESTLTGIAIMKTSAINDYYTAYRDYVAAVQALEGASSIGPAYSSGGMTMPGM